MTRPAMLPLLTGERVHLRAMRQDDVAALFALQSDPVGMRYWPLLDRRVTTMTAAAMATSTTTQQQRDGTCQGLIALIRAW